MGIKDLTNDQLIEIAGLLFSWTDEAIGEIRTNYWDGIVDFGHGVLDHEGERQLISFDFKYHTKIVEIRCWIYSNLSCDIDSYTEDPILKIDRLPTRNQYKIQKLFEKWNIEPKFEENENS